MAIILITHDLGVVAEIADDVAVMYAGRDRRDRAAWTRSSREPQHPYTIGLLGSIPRLHREQERLPAIAGQVPDPLARARRVAASRRAARSRAERMRARSRRSASSRRATQAACWHAPLDAERRRAA